MFFSTDLAFNIRWSKFWGFNFSSILPMNIQDLTIDWFEFLAVQETLKSLLQHHSLKKVILQGSDFLMVQLSHPYMTTGKTIALTRLTFVGKVMSLLFNMLSI